MKLLHYLIIIILLILSFFSPFFFLPLQTLILNIFINLSTFSFSIHFSTCFSHWIIKLNNWINCYPLDCMMKRKKVEHFFFNFSCLWDEQMIDKGCPKIPICPNFIRFLFRPKIIFSLNNIFMPSIVNRCSRASKTSRPKLDSRK